MKYFILFLMYSSTLFACIDGKEFYTSTNMKLVCDKTYPVLKFALKDPRGVVWGIVYSDDMAAVEMNWDDAKAYCEQHGLKLPSNTEWDYMHLVFGHPDNCWGPNPQGPCYRPGNIIPSFHENAFWSRSKIFGRDPHYFWRGSAAGNVDLSSNLYGVMCISI